MSRRLLVVTTVPVEGELLRRQVREHAGAADAEVRVVAPAADISPLQWLASDEDEAREAEAEVGDVDPVQAIEDALREFPADEVIVVTRRGSEAGWLEEDAAEAARERFDVPISRLEVEGG